LSMEILYTAVPLSVSGNNPVHGKSDSVNEHERLQG